MTEHKTGSTISRAKSANAGRVESFFTGETSLAPKHEGGANGEEGKGSKRSVYGTQGHMSTLTQLQQNRRIVQDFTVTTLAGLPGLLARLTYVASLRDLSSGRYEHEGLAALYPDEALQQAIGLCHEQVFERVLETPLSMLQEDLQTCLAAMQGGLRGAIIHWRNMESYRVLMPEQTPDYLKELFCSNLRALLEILQEECSPPRSSA